MSARGPAQHTFDNGDSIPFGVVEASPRTPHPLRLIPYRRPNERIIASVPPGRENPWFHDDCELEWVLPLDCVHLFPAVIQERKDGTLQLTCPSCRRRGWIELAVWILADPAKEREYRRVERSRRRRVGER